MNFNIDVCLEELCTMHFTIGITKRRNFMSLCVIGLIPLPLGEQFSIIFLFYVIQERVSQHI
ncbi:hypothetical protein MIDIC_510041 [Alphaproteobacteria bacterium]